jgi:hypothetical protein
MAEINQTERVRWMATEIAKDAGIDFDELSGTQQFLLMEQALMWSNAYGKYNAMNNIVEAQVDDSIFGFDKEGE